MHSHCIEGIVGLCPLVGRRTATGFTDPSSLVQALIAVLGPGGRAAPARAAWDTAAGARHSCEACLTRCERRQSIQRATGVKRWTRMGVTGRCVKPLFDRHLSPSHVHTYPYTPTSQKWINRETSERYAQGLTNHPSPFKLTALDFFFFLSFTYLFHKLRYIRIIFLTSLCVYAIYFSLLSSFILPRSSFTFFFPCVFV